MISHLYPSRTDDVYGSFVHSQVKALQDLGCEVWVVAPTAMAPFPLYVLKNKWRRFHDTPKQDQYQGVDVIYPRIVRTPGAAFFELAGLNYYYAMKEPVLAQHQARPFALIHAQVAYPDGWAAARLAEDLRLPLVLTLHGQELQKIVNWSKRLKKLVQTALDRAAAVVVPSAKMQALARKHGVREENLHLIYNGLEPLPEGELPREIRKRIAGKQVLLSVGRLEQEKGFQHNIEALNILKDKHPDLVYLVVGDGAYRPRLQELTDSLALQERVIFAGAQPRDKVQAYYGNSHVFSMPSRDESFGIVYLEAMAAGLPVIGTKGEGIAPLLEENPVGRLVDYGDPSKLALHISELLDPVTGAELGQRGREVAAGFSWPRNARKLLTVYNNLTQVIE
jgi:glycosyltransferase involved in cell wall biosynthesis